MVNFLVKKNDPMEEEYLVYERPCSFRHSAASVRVQNVRQAAKKISTIGLFPISGTTHTMYVRKMKVA